MVFRCGNLQTLCSSMFINWAYKDDADREFVIIKGRGRHSKAAKGGALSKK